MTHKVYEAIAQVSHKLSKDGISKSRTNEQQRYKFRGIDEVLNTLAPLMAEAKLVIIPRVLHRECIERATKSGNALFYTTVQVEFDFVSAEDGSKHTACTFGEAMDSADKSTNKAMSAAYKYAAIQTFCIPTEGDNDADATTHDVAPAPKPQPLTPKEWAKQQVNLLMTMDKEGIEKWKVAKAADLERLKAKDIEAYNDLMDAAR